MPDAQDRQLRPRVPRRTARQPASCRSVSDDDPRPGRDRPRQLGRRGRDSARDHRPPDHARALARGARRAREDARQGRQAVQGDLRMAQGARHRRRGEGVVVFAACAKRARRSILSIPAS